MRNDGVLGNANRIGFDVLGEISGFDLPQNTLVKRAVAFGLPSQLLITDGGAV